MGTGPVGSVFGKNLFYRETSGYKTRGFRHVAKHSSDPRVAYPEVKVQVRDLVRVVCIVAPFAPWARGSIREKNRFIDLVRVVCIVAPFAPRARGSIREKIVLSISGHMRPVPGATSSGMPRVSQTKFWDGTVWGL